MQVDGITNFDVDDVAAFVDLHVGRQRDAAILLEFAREQVARTATVTFGICHYLLAVRTRELDESETRPY